ncbi:hypothetical protein [Pseudonocardia spinosispora]|uniref:hypothetical protein n=1 Tax=Pseudonocardia spinosispora TaxID=103441 RepID=UPI000563A419|nr:hypothetical protein [Pseudonocardia spinosispora]
MTRSSWTGRRWVTAAAFSVLAFALVGGVAATIAPDGPLHSVDIRSWIGSAGTEGVSLKSDTHPRKTPQPERLPTDPAFSAPASPISLPPPLPPQPPAPVRIQPPIPTPGIVASKLTQPKRQLVDGRNTQHAGAQKPDSKKQPDRHGEGGDHKPTHRSRSSDDDDDSGLNDLTSSNTLLSN